MVRMKLSKEEFNEKELDVEYEGPKFERYTGDIPKTGTVLTARVTKGWWLQNDDGEQQTKLMVVAEQNNGQTKEYNGLPTWETLTWEKRASGRYMPFLMNFDLSVGDVYRKLDVEPDDDNIGTPINSIGDWVIGSDDALCRIVIKRDWYQPAGGEGEWRSKIDWDGWLPYEDSDADADADDEEEEDERPARRPARRAAKAAKPATRAPVSRRRGDPDEEEDEEEEYDDDVVDDEDEDEEEEEAPPPRRSRRVPARAAARASARPAARTARGGGASRSASRTANTRANKAAGRDRASGGSDEEPPF